MEEQISLFDNIDENVIVDMIEKSLPDYLKESGNIYIKPNSKNTPHSSIMFSPVQSTSCYRTKEIPDGLICGIKANGKTKFVLFSMQFENLLTENGLKFYKIESQNFWRVDMNDFYQFALNDSEAFCKFISNVIVSLFAFDRFDCCGKFKECSDAKKCLHDDMLYSTACSYRKKLENGIVFYGKNRTTDLPKTDSTPKRNLQENRVKKVRGAITNQATIKSTIPPKTEWKKFASRQEKVDKYRKWKFISDKATWTKTLIYSGIYTDIPVPCDIIGYTEYDEAVITLYDKLHTINPIYLLQMQSFESPAKLPSKTIPTDYIVLDIETTGLSVKEDKIIEIAAAKVQGGKVLDSFETLVNPEMHIPSRAQKVSHITDEMVSDAPIIQVAISQFLEFIEDLPLVAHNGTAFDFKFIKKEVEAIGKKITNFTFDTLTLSRLAFPDCDNHQLSTLVEYLEIETKNTHRAMPDVLATVSLFQKCYEEFMPKTKYAIEDE